MESNRRESGVALFGTIVAMVVLLSVTGAAVALSITDLRAVQNGRDQLSAFYLAEGGLQRAKWEIGEDVDPDTDGIGNLAVSSANGDTTVAAVEVSADVFELTSTGATASASVSLVETVVLRWTPSAPDGAISVIGGVDFVEHLFNSNANLIIDGGPSSPAIVMGDADFHSEFVSGLDDAISGGYVDASNLTGGGLTGTDSLQHDPNAVADLSTFYSDLVSHFTGLIPGADSTSLPSSSDIVYGSSGAPVTKYFSADSKLKSGQKLRGHGTLIFSNLFEIENGASIDWNGDIVVLVDSPRATNFLIDGKLKLTGNLAMLSKGNQDAMFLVKGNGEVDVVGAVTAMTNFANPSTKLELLVENKFRVDGIVTIGAGIHQIEFKQGSDTFIRGMLQIAVADAKKFSFKVESALEIVRNLDLLTDGIEALGSVNGTVSSVGRSSTSERSDIFSYGWGVTY